MENLPVDFEYCYTVILNKDFIALKEFFQLFGKIYIINTQLNTCNIIFIMLSYCFMHFLFFNLVCLFDIPHIILKSMYSVPGARRHNEGGCSLYPPRSILKKLLLALFRQTDEKVTESRYFMTVGASIVICRCTCIFHLIKVFSQNFEKKFPTY